ncbi:L-serine ammonia-lyase, iron-sulfur-dependent, subunit alpha [Clostridium faecium]|uniref:L-serine dehydratase n=1 Tax=Clostridium faecium TaxID=2762223 RepID=A0ABR8YP77_9CLOT|nr:L-serine ammonia-lyase, iron-sulfur-dependent, subunit alpha [Clostridium faecium]MBD8046045.1 L-serine ammonia-lyase, iron-sulfur-dependent, subunit alpha [Clostridium faecium]MDU1349093.1 L-serine ammonia-lyase, iron-sulfur-dependent, subunit alpha [Clostridium argentinense]
MFATNAVELIEICEKEKISIAEYTIREEIETTGLTREEVIEKMRRNLEVIKKSSREAMEKEVISVSGLIGGDAIKIRKYLEKNKGNTLCGETIVTAMARALSTSEVNAAMGKVVAAPTAGSCGIIPGVITTAGEKLNKTEEDLIMALYTAAGVGIIIAKNATLSGAEGGCQAECGSAAAMGAAAVVEMMGGTPSMAFDAAAIVIKNVEGLVCDPIAGLVEIPCAKRNVAGAVSALTTAELVMAGIKSKIPFDDCIAAMYKVGRELPSSLRETAMGGLAVTPCGLKLRKQVLKENN